MTATTVFGRAKLGLLALALGTLLSACGAINTIPTLEERAKSTWGEVQNQYQRRADLIPNLVETVKGYAAQEREVLTQVTEARARATQVRVDASTITDPQKFKEYQVAGLLQPERRDDLFWTSLYGECVMLTPLGEFYRHLAENNLV